MSGIVVIVASEADATRPCDRRKSSPSAADKYVAGPTDGRRPSSTGLLGECDEPPRPLPRGRMRHMIHQAVVDGRLPTVQLLVDKMGEPVDAQDIYGRTALMLACLLGDERLGNSIVRLLLSRGASSNETDAQERTALHYSCMGGKQLIVHRLLDDPGQRCVNNSDIYGFTALMYSAMRRGTADMVRELIADGAAVDARNRHGYTPLMLAARCGNYSAAAALLHDGHATTTIRDDEYHRSALEWTESSTTPYYALQRSTRGRNTACNMYTRFKPFRCQHRSTSSTSDCTSHVTRGVPELFQQQRPAVDSASRQSVTDTKQVSRDELIAALKEVYERQVGSSTQSMQRHGAVSILAAPLMDASHIVNATNLVSPTSSTARLPPVVTPDVDAEPITAPAAGPSPPRPPTPELIAVGPTTPMMRPDLGKLFSLYYPDPTKPSAQTAVTSDPAADNTQQLPTVNVVTSQLSNRILLNPD